MATLYDLKGNYISLLALVGDPDVDDDVLRDTMEAAGGELEEKADAYAVIMKELEANVNTIDDEIKRLQGRKAGYKRNADRMKAALQETMIQTGKTKFKTPLFSFGIQKNPPSVVLDVDDWKDIPEDYLKYKDPDIDKAAIKRDLQAGKDLEGVAHLIQTEGLRIR